MRVALIVIAALLALGLSALGFVATQRAPNASVFQRITAPRRQCVAPPQPQFLGNCHPYQNSRLPSSPVGPPTAGVLTFDDGPWPQNTPAALKALADECLKATFFEIGVHAVWHPEITKQVIEAGTTVGAHTWSHKDLARNPYAKDIELAEQEIEMGNSAVQMAAGSALVAPFFRFPDLQHPSQLLKYLAQRNIAIFSTDIDSRDFNSWKSAARAYSSCTTSTATSPPASSAAAEPISRWRRAASSRDPTHCSFSL